MSPKYSPRRPPPAPPGPPSSSGGNSGPRSGLQPNCKSSSNEASARITRIVCLRAARKARSAGIPPGTERLSQQIVLHREQRRGRPGGDADLLEDVLNVVPGGLGRDVERARDLLVGEAARQ